MKEKVLLLISFVFFLAKSEWVTYAQFQTPIPRFWHASACFTGVCYIYGGRDINNALGDFQKGTISPLGGMSWGPVSFSGANPGLRQLQNMITINDDSFLFFAGQKEISGNSNATNDMFQFFRSNNTMVSISYTTSPPPIREGAAACFMKGQLFVYGGHIDNELPLLGDLWSFNLATRAWTQINGTGVIPPAVVGASLLCSSTRNQLILFGGTAETLSNLSPFSTSVPFSSSNLFTLDLNTKIWKTTPPTPDFVAPLYLGIFSFLPNREDMAVFFGSIRVGTSDDRPYLVAFDFTSNQWKKIFMTGTETANVAFPAVGFFDSTQAMMWGGLQRNPILGVSDALGAYDFKNIQAEFGTQTITPPTASPANAGAIAGAVIGVLILIAVIAVIAFFLIRRRKQQKFIHNQHPLMVQTATNFSATSPYTNPLLSATPPAPNYQQLQFDSSKGSNNTGIIPRTIVTIPGSHQKIGEGFGRSYDIDFKDIKVEGEIGRGAFGTVFKGTWRQTEVAIKYLPVQDESSEAFLDFKKEVEVMMSLRPHPNVILLLGIVVNPHCIITEYLKNGSLWTFLRNPNNELSKEKIMVIVKGIAAGMMHLNSEGIVHRDLAARNILLSSEFLPKISDFGLSRLLQEDLGGVGKTQSQVGPLKYMAPECILSQQYSQKSDVWAFGVTIYEVVTRGEPYPGMNPVEVSSKVSLAGLRLVLPQKFHQEYETLVTLMANCFATKPEDRPTFQQICEFLQ